MKRIFLLALILGFLFMATASAQDPTVEKPVADNQGFTPAKPDSSGTQKFTPALPVPSNAKGFSPAKPESSASQGFTPALPTPSTPKGFVPSNPSRPGAKDSGIEKMAPGDKIPAGKSALEGRKRKKDVKRIQESQTKEMQQQVE